MWLTGGSDPVWIQYEFDRAYKLHEMWVWNSNQVIEPFIGFGVKEALVETSLDGVTWMVVEGVTPLAQGTGQDTYAPNTTVNFAGTLAKYVKLTVVSAHRSSGQIGLSEVRILAIPNTARAPEPAHGATDMRVNSVLNWRAGREAASHQVYLGTDEHGLVLAGTTDQPSLADLSLDYNTTYHWSVTEVNNSEAMSSYAGPTWRFTTAAYTVIDDFETYTDNMDADEAIFQTWIDGFDDDSNGSQVGHIDVPFTERTIVRSGSTQSMPVTYDNTTASSSEISVDTDDLALGRDWTIGSPVTMTLWFYGDPDNAAAQIYVKIGSTRVDYPGDGLRNPGWNQWNIDLATIALGDVRAFSIGLDRITAGSGMILVDDIRLYRDAP
jgi:hypothetical protein